jgi:predicted O-methyltransferase YrrM
VANPNYYRPDIQGWSSDILPWYAARADELPDGAKYVELGVYHGRSVLFLAEYLYDQGKFRSHILAVDTWAEVVDGERTWETFKRNRSSIGVAASLVFPEMDDSAAAADYCSDNSVDLVFIDAGHDALSISADIAAWWPKLRPGRVFGGHDYRAEVQAAVDAFVARERLQLTVQHSVWWVRKP